MMENFRENEQRIRERSQEIKRLMIMPCEHLGEDKKGGGIIFAGNLAAGDATVENNLITDNTGSGLALNLIEGKSVKVRNNKIDNNAGSSSYGIYSYIAGTGGLMTIQNNPVTNSGAAGVYLIGVKTGSTISDFLVQNSGGAGIRADSSDLSLENVTLTGNVHDGIYFVSGKSFAIRNSTIDNNGGGIIYAGNAGTGDATVEKNIITNNLGSGVSINLAMAKSANIRNNRIENNIGTTSNGVSINIAGTGGVLAVENNSIINNEKEGLILTGAKNSKVINNNISMNSFGVRLYSSSGNSIYHNNFIDNSNNNPSDNVGPNSWDSGYPGGGNY